MSEPEIIPMSKAVARKEDIATPAPVAESGIAAPQLLSMLQAVMANPEMSIERINQAFDFYQRVDAMQAKKAFDAALAAAQAEFPPIAKNRRVHFESKDKSKDPTDYRHEDLAQLVETCGPILAKHGISYKWRTKNEVNEPIVVTCVLTHLAGHSEENTLRGPRDESGNKNSLQGIASTVTYLERYTFKSAIGVASRHDDDGRASGETLPNTITDEQYNTLNEKLEATGSDKALFCRFFKIDGVALLPADKYDKAVKMLNDKAGRK